MHNQPTQPPQNSQEHHYMTYHRSPEHQKYHIILSLSSTRLSDNTHELSNVPYLKPTKPTTQPRKDAHFHLRTSDLSSATKETTKHKIQFRKHFFRGPSLHSSRQFYPDHRSICYLIFKPIVATSSDAHLCNIALFGSATCYLYLPCPSQHDRPHPHII